MTKYEYLPPHDIKKNSLGCYPPEVTKKLNQRIEIYKYNLKREPSASTVLKWRSQFLQDFNQNMK